VNTQEMHDVAPSTQDMLPGLIAVLTALEARAQTLASLSASLRLPARVLALWVGWSVELGWVWREGEAVGLTEGGAAFVGDVEGRPEALREAVVAHPWMRRVALALAGELRGELFTAGEGQDEEEEEVTEAVVRRLGPLVSAAVWPERYDWTDGRRCTASSRFGLSGPVFVELLAAHLGDSASGLEIDFPAGLKALVGEGREVVRGLAASSPEVFGAGRRGLQYGGLPMSAEVEALSAQDLAMWAVATCPYVSLATLLLWAGHRRWGAEELYVARDLWGLKLWLGGRPCGDLLELVEEAARELGVRVVHRGAGSGGAGLLLDLMSSLGLLTTRRTRHVLRASVVRRMERQGAPDVVWGGSLARLLGPVELVLAELIAATAAGS